MDGLYIFLWVHLLHNKTDSFFVYHNFNLINHGLYISTNNGNLLIYSFDQQVELCRAEASHRVTQNLPTIVEGLRAKKKKEIDDRRATGEDVSDSELENIKFDTDNIEIPPLPEKHSCIQIPTGS